jgi:hypothetical protein
MPLRSKKSRSAKQRHQNACTAFVKHASCEASPEGSEFHPMSDDSNISWRSKEKHDHNGQYGVKNSVKALQHIYAKCLPHHLHVEKATEETHKKHCKVSNRKSIFNGSLHTTKYQRRIEWKHTAEGCQTLDSFVVRKVCHSIYMQATYGLVI